MTIFLLHLIFLQIHQSLLLMTDF